MTDEEMAVNWIRSQGWSEETLPSDEFGQMSQAFLAGLKAGRPKWHKVADGDLPSEEGGWVCNQNGLPCFFDWGTEQWLDCEGTQIRTTEWCYMPHKR